MLLKYLLTLAVVDDVASFMVRRASHPHGGEVPLELYLRLVGSAHFTPQRID